MILADFGSFLVILAQIMALLAHFCPISGHLGPILGHFGVDFSIFGQFWPFRPFAGAFGAGGGRDRASLGRVRPILGQF